jgi:hypothetical protein
MFISRRGLVAVLLAMVAAGPLASPTFGQGSAAERLSAKDRVRPNFRKQKEAMRVARQLAHPGDAKLIRDAAWAASVIYSHETKTDAHVHIRNDLVAKGLLRGGEVVYVRNLSIYAWDFYVAWDDQTVYLVFRGGKGTNAQKSIFAGAIPNLFNGSHTGAGVAQATIRSRVEHYLKQAGASNKRLVIAGHSMGGMMAGITGWILMNDGARVDAVVTLGTPRYGDGNFEKYFEELANRRGVGVYCVENPHDNTSTLHTPFTQSRVGRNVDLPFSESTNSLVNEHPHSERGYYEFAQMVYDYRPSAQGGRPGFNPVRPLDPPQRRPVRPGGRPSGRPVGRPYQPRN